MKEGWEIKKLGEICKLYQPKTISTDKLVEDGAYAVYGANGIIGRYNEYNHSERELLMTCRGATCGTINVSQPYSWINGNAMVIHPLLNNLNFDFLKYYLVFVDLSDVITGAAQPQITRQSLNPIKIPVPPLSEQQRIVSELDCISGIIEKKKQQLTELDTLAQSIFYDMFGDPITNEKGWEIKKLGEVCFLKAGKNIQAKELFDKPQQGRYPCFGGNGIRGYINKVSHVGTFPIIGRQGALCGNVVLAKEQFYATEHAVVVQPIIETDTIWLYFLLKFLDLNRYAQGVAQPGISVKIIEKIPIPLPPLPLQQSFAAKVEAIEKQKALIKQSIAETETLLASRMDYYFN